MRGTRSFAWGNLPLLAALMVVNTTGYLLLNANPLSAPRHLPLSWVDRALPFLPWTVWPYAALLVADVLLPLLVRNAAVFRRVFAAYCVAIATNSLIWAIFPTVMARPTPPAGPSLSEALYRLLIAVDGAGNCFPSGHVTLPAIGVWGLSLEHPRWRAPLWGALAIASLSILTTKQHYLVDLFGGLATAALAIAAAGPVLALLRPAGAPTAAPEP